MKLDRLPGHVNLTYCTNIHAGKSWAEVRANLEQPAPKQRRSQPAASQGPALSDYLRGRRSA